MYEYKYDSMGIYLEKGIEVNTIFFQQEAVLSISVSGTLCVNMEEEVDETL